MQNIRDLSTIGYARNTRPEWTLDNPGKCLWVDMEYFFLTSPFTSCRTGRVYSGDTLQHLHKLCDAQGSLQGLRWEDYLDFIFEVGQGSARRRTMYCPRELSWAFMSVEKGRDPQLIWDCMEVRYPLAYEDLKYHARSGCNAWDYHQVHYLRKHIHGLPFYPTDRTNQVTLLSASCLLMRALLHTQARHICIKGSAMEAIIVERMLAKASQVMQVITPSYEFHVTQNPFLIAPHWRVKHGRMADLQPFIDMVAQALPQHSHAGLPAHPTEPRPDHCSAVEVLYYSTHYQYLADSIPYLPHFSYPKSIKYQRPPPKEKQRR